MVLESTFGRIEFRVSETVGGSRVDLIHSGLPENEEIAAGCESGWRMSLALLKLYGENYWDQEKRTEFVSRPARFEYADAFAWFSKKEKLGKWLRTFAKTNEPLAMTGREACWRWDAVGGALEMKAYGSGAEDRQLALRAVSWSRGYDLAPVRGELENSLDHLRKLLIP
jgi:hypothetical protein